VTGQQVSCTAEDEDQDRPGLDMGSVTDVPVAMKGIKRTRFQQQQYYNLNH